MLQRACVFICMYEYVFLMHVYERVLYVYLGIYKMFVLHYVLQDVFFCLLVDFTGNLKFYCDIFISLIKGVILSLSTPLFISNHGKSVFMNIFLPYALIISNSRINI